VGSAARWIDSEGRLLSNFQPATDPVIIQQMLLGAIPFLHGTFVFRSACLCDLDGGYNEAYPVAQDCDLLLRMSDSWQMANIPDILYVHRRHRDTVSAHRGSEQRQFLAQTQQAAIARRLAYGWRRVGWPRQNLPAWLLEFSRRRLAQRYVWWSAGARERSRRTAAQFLVIALLLDPTTPEIWRYIAGIVGRKARRLIGSATPRREGGAAA
jgi:hypothetical protein